MSDFYIEVLKFFMWIFIWWSIVFLWGMIYGASKKLGIVLAILGFVSAITFIIWGFIYFIPSMTASDFSLGSFFGGFFGGWFSMPVAMAGASLTNHIKEVWRRK